MEKQIEKLIENIIQDYKNFLYGSRYNNWPSAIDHRNQQYDRFIKGVRVVDGKKYVKIITEGGGVWGFINKGNDKFRVGDILKAASWAAPALNKARGNILDGDYEIRWTGPLCL